VYPKSGCRVCKDTRKRGGGTGKQDIIHKTLGQRGTLRCHKHHRDSKRSARPWGSKYSVACNTIQKSIVAEEESRHLQR